MADATLDNPVTITGVNLRSVTIRQRPRYQAIIVFVYERSDGTDSEEIIISLEGARAASFMQAWMQANPVRKMIADLRTGGELAGVTET